MWCVFWYYGGVSRVQRGGNNNVTTAGCKTDRDWSSEDVYIRGCCGKGEREDLHTNGRHIGLQKKPGGKIWRGGSPLLLLLPFV